VHDAGRSARAPAAPPHSQGEFIIPPGFDSRQRTEDAMELKDQTDHIALLSLMMVGVLTKRLIEVEQLDKATAEHLHKLVNGVRAHAKAVGLTDLNVLFDNIDKSLSERQAPQRG